MKTQIIRFATLVVMIPILVATAVAQNAPPPTTAQDYRIGVGDVLTVSIYRDESLSGDVIVRPDGKITLKTGNEITAAGLRVEQLKARVIAELTRLLKTAPEVFIQVKQINSRETLQSAGAAITMLEVSGPTYFADGETRGASARWALTLKQPIEMYQTSGETLCASASAFTSKPSDAGSGWRLTIVPLHLGRELVLSVNWQRLWERGETLTNGPKGSAVITLQAGQRILLDYITAGELAPAQNVVWRPGAPNEPMVRYPSCGAVGMGLQIGLPAARSETFVETSLWLVRTLADGSERVRQQTVRTRTGTTAEFVFDDDTITLRAPKPMAQGAAQSSDRSVRTSGRLRPIVDGTGKVTMEVTLAQYLVDRPGSADRMNGGSATFELTAGPEEVVAFRVPQVVDDSGRVGERMSLRVQMKVLNR